MEIGAVATDMAKNKIRNKIKHEHRSESEMIGNVKMVANATYMLVGFAKWLDAKWAVERVTDFLSQFLHRHRSGLFEISRLYDWRCCQLL